MENLLPWYALRVRTNGERKVEAALTLKNYTVFLPTYLDVRQYSDRIKKVERALFPGYLFCRLDINWRGPVLVTPGVDSIVNIGGAPEPVPEPEIAAVRAVVDAGLPAVPWPYLGPGDTVRIAFGSLAGAEGQIVRVHGAERLVLSIHLLQRSIGVELDRTWVRPVGSGASGPRP